MTRTGAARSKSRSSGDHLPLSQTQRQPQRARGPAIQSPLPPSTQSQAEGMPPARPWALSTSLFWSSPHITVVKLLPFLQLQALPTALKQGNESPSDRVGKATEFPETSSAPTQIYYVLSGAEKGWYRGMGWEEHKPCHFCGALRRLELNNTCPALLPSPHGRPQHRPF